MKQPDIRTMNQAAVGLREPPEIEKIYYMPTNQCVNVDCTELVLVETIRVSACIY